MQLSSFTLECVSHQEEDLRDNYELLESQIAHSVTIDGCIWDNTSPHYQYAVLQFKSFDKDINTMACTLTENQALYLAKHLINLFKYSND